MENKTKYTPGPWTVSKRTTTRKILNSSGGWIGDVGNPWTPYDDIAEANAQLIAAAPALLAALKAIIAEDGFSYDLRHEIAIKAMAAIEKAEGDNQ